MPTPTPTRTCAWPTNLNGDESIPVLLDGPADQRCGLTDPSYDAHYDPTADPIPVCDIHRPSAQTHGLHVTPAGQVPDHLWTELNPTTTPPPADDVELTTLANIAEAMAGLPDDDTRRRVATWVADRYGAPI